MSLSEPNFSCPYCPAKFSIENEHDEHIINTHNAPVSGKIPDVDLKGIPMDDNDAVQNKISQRNNKLYNILKCGHVCSIFTYHIYNYKSYTINKCNNRAYFKHFMSIFDNYKVDIDYIKALIEKCKSIPSNKYVLSLNYNVQIQNLETKHFDITCYYNIIQIYDYNSVEVIETPYKQPIVKLDNEHILHKINNSNPNLKFCQNDFDGQIIKLN